MAPPQRRNSHQGPMTNACMALEILCAVRLISLRLILRSFAKQCVSKDGAAPWFETLACAALRQAPRHEAGRGRGGPAMTVRASRRLHDRLDLVEPAHL